MVEGADVGGGRRIGLELVWFVFSERDAWQVTLFLNITEGGVGPVCCADAFGIVKGFLFLT